MTTKITEKNISSIANRFVSWQSIKTSGFTAVAGEGYFCNTTSTAFTVTLPATAIAGDTITIKDYAGTFATNKLTIDRNGHNIQGAANNSLIQTNRAAITLVYIDSTRGWEYVKESNVADLQSPLFITATGGTITTDGDYKVHSFTGDGCFVVSQLGNSPTVPTGGPQNVDYLVVAGGGGGGMDSGGGGGAGGLRMSSNFPITTTTYPITIGAGGAGRSANNWGIGSPGSNSTFSTITSSGGGGGGSNTGSPTRSPVNAGGSGGSGGGHGAAIPGPSAKAAGNTPPVSPSQGNPGGSGSGNAAPNYAGGGGGGSGTAGSNSSPTNGGAGGSGTDVTPIFGAAPKTFYIANGPNAGASSPGVFAGGGGGGVGSNCQTFPGSPPSLAGSGGTGGGGNGVVPSLPGAPGGVGVENTGGGGGGAGYTPGGYTSRQGGKGIVLIRYKFQ